jgi:uncharacterized protein (TIGR03118 family)
VTRRLLWLAASAAALAGLAGSAGAVDRGYVLRPLVSDGGVPAAHRDPGLVNAWGLAAGPTGVWWATSEARNVSTLYSGAGRKQLLNVSVPGGPTGIVFYGGRGFRVTANGRSDPARFIYACEDGHIRAWTPTVPSAWSTQAEVVVDRTGTAAIFRGITIAGGRLYATDFHNARVDVFDERWRPVELPGRFRDPDVPSWFAPSGIQRLAGHLFVTFIGRAPVNGNDAPTGGYVDEFDLDGRLVARVATSSQVNEPWGLALAPRSFGRFGGDLLVASFGDGQIEAFRRTRGGWQLDGALGDTNGRPLVVNGVWGIAFGNGSSAGPRNILFAAAGPHRWLGSSELAVHGLIAAISPA